MATRFVFNPLSGQFDLISDILGFVPYTGATADVNLGTHSLTTLYLVTDNIELNNGAITNAGNINTQSFNLFDAGIADYGSIILYDNQYNFNDSSDAPAIMSGKSIRLYDNIIDQSGFINLDNSVYYFKDWDGAYNTVRAYAFVADPSGTTSQFYGGTSDLGTYPLSGGNFFYSHANASYDGFSFISNDVNDEWGGGSGIYSNPEEGSTMYSQGSGFQTAANNLSVYTNGGSILTGDISGARIFGTQGSAPSPTYGFLSDSNTGMYLFGADVLAFTVGGTDRMLIGNAAISISVGTGITGTLTVSTSVMTPFIFGSSNSGANFNIRSTSNATKGKVTFGLAATTAYDEANDRFGVGVATPLAAVHIKAGTTAASTAPLKFTSGSLNTTAEAGAVEFLTDKYYGTITTGAARKEFALNDIALTSGRLPFATTNGRFTDSANLAYTSGTGLLLSDNLKLTTAGNGIYIKEGTNACMGLATLVGGTVVVNTTKTTANSRIQLTGQGGNITNLGSYNVTARTAGTSFTITSSNVLDTNTVAWEIREPA